jgi:hypothetical protein
MNGDAAARRGTRRPLLVAERIDMGSLTTEFGLGLAVVYLAAAIISWRWRTQLLIG